MTTRTHASPDWLRATLRAHGISQLAAARMLGLSPAYLRCWLMSPACPSSRRMPVRQAQRLLALLAERGQSVPKSAGKSPK